MDVHENRKYCAVMVDLDNYTLMMHMKTLVMVGCILSLVADIENAVAGHRHAGEAVVGEMLAVVDMPVGMQVEVVEALQVLDMSCGALLEPPP